MEYPEKGAQQSRKRHKCLIPTCEYHTIGFEHMYDRNKHTLTHYKGTMNCGFCPVSGSATERSFDRTDVFKRHLISVHGVEQTPPGAKKQSRRDYKSDEKGICSTCGLTFASPQRFYEHLDDCILRWVEQTESREAVDKRLLTLIADDERVQETLKKHMLTTTVEEAKGGSTSNGTWDSSTTRTIESYPYALDENELAELSSWWSGKPENVRSECAQMSVEAGLPANPDGSQVTYSHHGYTHPTTGAKDSDGAKDGNQSLPNLYASSYWSVPEQMDFEKYIGHFGRDFAAIAAHMSSKTQLMIMNHFQRQIESGNRSDLEEAADNADDRRARGEDMGPPPKPTRIVQRQYVTHEYVSPSTFPSLSLASGTLSRMEPGMPALQATAPSGALWPAKVPDGPKAFSYPVPPPSLQEHNQEGGPSKGFSLSLPGYSQGSLKSLTSSKMHKCPYCPTEFTRQHRLKRHLLTHAQEKPYACETCQARFRRLHDLKRHVKLPVTYWRTATHLH